MSTEEGLAALVGAAKAKVAKLAGRKSEDEDSSLLRARTICTSNLTVSHYKASLYQVL